MRTATRHFSGERAAVRAQSISEALARLIKAVRGFAKKKDVPAATAMKDEISRFYDSNMKYLMYRDWSGFELFFIEILKCGSLPALHQISHRFETFLMTLYREVQKRSILDSVPMTPELAGIDANS